MIRRRTVEHRAVAAPRVVRPGRLAVGVRLGADANYGVRLCARTLLRTMSLRLKHVQLDESKLNRARKIFGVGRDQEAISRAIDFLLERMPEAGPDAEAPLPEQRVPAVRPRTDPVESPLPAVD